MSDNYGEVYMSWFAVFSNLEPVKENILKTVLRMEASETLAWKMLHDPNYLVKNVYTDYRYKQELELENIMKKPNFYLKIQNKDTFFTPKIND